MVIIPMLIVDENVDGLRAFGSRPSDMALYSNSSTS